MKLVDIIRILFAGTLVSFAGAGCSAANDKSMTKTPPKDMAEKTVENMALAKTHKKITERFDGVTHIKAADLTKLDPVEVVIFDTREPKEFAVSHLSGAVQIDPNMSAEEFTKNYSELIKNKAVVFYCSVGMRSSIMADRVKNSLQANASSKVYNLEKGIFGWHNQSLPLRQGAASTDFVHPYNAYWGRMIDRQDYTRYNVE